jgi:hypothetical protein
MMNKSSKTSPPLPWECEQLSRDHKPNLTGESERILQLGGRIESYKD